MDETFPNTCIHHLRPVIDDIEVTACGTCGIVDWFRDGEAIDPYDGLAEVFGMFDLVATLPGVAAPGPEVMLYSAPRRPARDLLKALPHKVWLLAAPGLAVSTDGRHLVISPFEPQHVRGSTG